MERNLYNFNLGRLYTINPGHEIFSFLSENEVKELNSIELFEDRLERIKIYDDRLVEDFKKDKNLIDLILSQEADTENITKEAIKELYRVYAIKDEYEVARMHLESTAKILDNTFNSWNNLKFYLSPPVISFIKDKRTQRPIKIAIPGYIALPIFRILKSMKFLRGTFFDPLSFSQDRKQDKEHKEIFRNKLGEIHNLITGTKGKKLSELIAVSKEVKGYGPVRAASYEIFKARINFHSKKTPRIFNRFFRFKSKTKIPVKKHKAQKENRAE